LVFHFILNDFFDNKSEFSDTTMSKSKEEQLWDACTSGDLELVKLLAKEPSVNVNVNWADPERNRTP